MTNIRIVRSKVTSNTQLEIVFTHDLYTGIDVSNITITSLNGAAPDLDVFSVSISGKIMTVTTRAMVSRAYYQAVLASSSSQIFKGARGENFIEDGATNYIFFVGPEEYNEIRDAILDDIPDIYNKESGSVIFNTIDTSAREILTASHKSGEVESANYVSIEVSNEKVTRGSGPYDRLANEGAFQILRVSSSEEATTKIGTITFTSFPSDPVSLQQVLVEDEKVSNSTNTFNSFAGLIISVTNKEVIKVTSITLTRNSTNYQYNISQYGYGLLTSKYDSEYAYTALDIVSNQIKLNNEAIGPTFPFPQGNDLITITYYYKKVGRDVDSDSIEITKSLSIVRETIPAVSTSFFLDAAPILNSTTGATAVLNGIQWLDPAKNYNPNLDHPAFVLELKYSASSLPSNPGEYMVNYETGQVFVYGVDGSGVDGTTTIPPVANYTAKYTYQEGIDYNFFSDLDEIASLPNGILRNAIGTISFNYEDAFANSTDFNFNSHIEVIDERVKNRLIDNIGIRTLYSPVNEVFRIYNETTGEKYTTTRIIRNEVYFYANNAPVITTVTREAVIFKQVLQAQLVISEEISVTGKSFVVFKILLPDTKIASATGNFIGASFDTSLEFSNNDLFIREFYYDDSTSVSNNLSRLLIVGDYNVDYENGFVYLAVTSGTTTDIGDASYYVAEVQTRNDHITSVTNLYRSASVSSSNTETFSIGTISDENVEIDDIAAIGEVEVNNSAIIVSSSAIQVSSDIFKLSYVFQVTDLKTTPNPINFATGATVSNSSPTNITLTNVSIEDSSLTVQQSGSKSYIEAERIASLFSSGLAQLVSAVSVVDEVTGVNYFSQGSDGYVESSTNRIYLPNNSALGRTVVATYTAKLLDGAAVLVGYTTGNMYIDYTYAKDELLISYEYGDNVLDWSISNTISEGSTYYVSYRYGALRNTLRDNFGVLTGIDELSVIKDNLTREVYRSAIIGALQTFPKGPTIPSIKTLVSSFTQIDPEIIESVFLEWILGRDYLNLCPMKLSANTNNELPTYAIGKFGNGLLLNKSGQTATLPTVSNLRFAEGTWESFVIPSWAGIDNDAYLTFDIKFDGNYDVNKVFIGSSSIHPSSVPFTTSRFSSSVLGKPSNLHSEIGYFIWYDTSHKKWRVRTRAPIIESRLFAGTITTTGEFNNVCVASTADGYDGYDGYEIDEINDILRSADNLISFSFVVDGYDSFNIAYDAYDAYNGGFAGFDGIDFSSDNLHYFLDTGLENNKNRMSIYKDGRGFIRFKIWDDNKHLKQISANISNWQTSETHHIAASWKIGTIEMKDEIHLFIDGYEIPNTYKHKGYLSAPNDAIFMEEAAEVLISSVSVPTIGRKDLSTTAGSNRVTSLGASFVSDGVQVNNRFLILDETTDGRNTSTSPYVYIKSILGENELELKTGTGSDYNAVATLDNVSYSINPLELFTVSNILVEKVRVYSMDAYGTQTELYSPDTLTPDYELVRDGYQDYVYIYNGIPIGSSALLYSYGLIMARYRQYVYLWPHLKTNVLKTIMPPPTSISKIDITKIISKGTTISQGAFALVATMVGGHIITTLSSNLDFCQPSNSVKGKRLSVRLYGITNLDFSGLNQVIFMGNTVSGSNSETITFTTSGTKTTNEYFTSLTDVIALFTPIDISKQAGVIEIRENYPLNRQENNGNYANVRLSIQDQIGNNGVATIGTGIVTDAYSRFGAEDIGKTFNISSPISIANSYKIVDVPLDPSGEVKDSNSVILNTTWVDAYSSINWTTLNTSYSDSGFANGLITLEIANSGGSPFLLGNCWYEVDFPIFLTIPWGRLPETLYIGSDMFGQNQASAVIDEMRILDELSNDTGRGELLPSSGRSITTDYLNVSEFTATTQTLGLFHFNDNLTNSANFYTNFNSVFRQSENSVNSSFGQSVVFNLKQSYQVDNKAVFDNDEGSIEFWISPILDTYNDPTKRYYIDLTPEQQVEVTALSSMTVILPVRARSVSVITVGTSTTNYFIGGELASNGFNITLGQPLPGINRTVLVTYVPITSQGDRFSLYKDKNNRLVFSITASGVDFQIRAPIYWKKNTWHRIFIGWDLNNTNNQDRMIMMVDGSETGVIRYGTGLIYGTGVLYGQPTVWGSADTGTTAARNILADINLLDIFNTVHIGADFTGQFTALVRMDNIRFSNTLRSIIYLGGSGPGHLLGKDLLYTSNTNTAQPVISDALTSLLLDFDTTQANVENLAVIRNASAGIFRFYVDTIDTFSLADTELIHNLITSLINRLKPAHTKAFVSFSK